MRRFPCFLVLTPLLLLTACGRFGDHRQKGLKYLEKKDFQHARLEFSQVVKADPTAEAHYYYALSCMELGDYAGADRSLRIAMNIEGSQVGPHTMDIRARLARVKFQTGDFEGAIRDASWVLKREPNNVRARETLAFSLGALSRPERAEGELQQLLSLEPANTQARVLMAAVKMTEGELEEAEHQLLLSVEQSKRSALALSALSNFYLVTRQTAKAEELLLEAVKNSPDAFDVQQSLGWLYERTRRYDKAEEVFRKISVRAAQDPKYRSSLADYYLYRNYWDKAIPELQSLKQRYPSDVPTQVHLAGAYYWGARFQDAQNELANILKADPTNPRALMVSALLKMQLGRTKEAILAFSGISRALADSAPLHYYEGLAYNKDRNFELAQQNMEQALKLDPKYIAARFWLADFFLRKGANDSAMGMLREAPEVQRDIAQLHLRIAQVHLANKREPLACAEVKAVSDADAVSIPDYYQIGFLPLLDKCGDAVRNGLEKALASDPTSAPLLTALAHVTAAGNAGSLQRAQALARVQKHLAAHPDLMKSVPHLVILANLQNGLGQRPAARETLKRAITLEPDAIEPVLALAQVELADQKLDAAAQYCEEMTRRWPKKALGWLWLGSVREVQGNLLETVRAYDTAVTLEPANPLAMNNLAWRLATDGGDSQRAVALAKRAVDLAPDNLAFADTLGVAYLKAKQYPAGKLVFDELILRDPSNPDYPYHLGLIEKESGSTSEAIGHLQTALTLKLKFPDSTTARDLIDELKKKQAR